MKKICNLLICLFVSSIFLVSCDDLLGVDSKRLTTEEDNRNTPNNSLYSTFGILSQVQKLADSYVLLGELRGDLLTTNESSDLSLKEINNFNITSNNRYVNISNYYAVINNCNYVLQNLDSSLVEEGQKLNLGQFAAVKSIRAWTYMQIALNFKTTKYYENAILTVEDSKKIYPEYDIEALADILIADLLPLKDVEFLDLGYIGSYNTSLSYFPIRFLLGDLYLLKSDYLNAATQYHDLMYKNRLTVNKVFTSSWAVVNNTIGTTLTINWISSFVPGSPEVLSTITCPTEYGQQFDLDSLNFQNKIEPSDVAMQNWGKQTYFLNEASNSQGDTRQIGSIWWKSKSSGTISAPTTYNSNDELSSLYTPFVLKYMLYKQNVVIYRSSLLYLRYAEAVNRLNKPNLAFAVLKYGLNSTNIINPKIIPVKEKDSISSPSSYMYFADSRFIDNVGIRMRGLGNADKDTTFYTLPKKDTMLDSVLYVENLIQEELALETAFEGNRFHDLVRIALRRIKNGEGTEAYLADLVSKKHVGNEAAIKTKLMNIDNWYIKK